MNEIHHPFLVYFRFYLPLVKFCSGSIDNSHPSTLPLLSSTPLSFSHNSLEGSKFPSRIEAYVGVASHVLLSTQAAMLATVNHSDVQVVNVANHLEDMVEEVVVLIYNKRSTPELLSLAGRESFYSEEEEI